MQCFFQFYCITLDLNACSVLLLNQNNFHYFTNAGKMLVIVSDCATWPRCLAWKQPNLTGISCAHADCCSPGGGGQCSSSEDHLQDILNWC